jgi:hydroxymethylpyrimidine pyrophosphatase-like HAD family hydrolase
VTKATGLRAALQALNVLAEETVGVGDAENDHAFLQLSGISVAVDNALDEVKNFADVVTTGARGTGVRELIDRLLSGELDAIEPDANKHLPTTSRS